jgi:hypothetical protein
MSSALRSLSMASVPFERVASGLALVVSVVATAYSRKANRHAGRAAIAAESLTRIEADRRTDELTARHEAEVASRDASKTAVLELVTIRTPGPQVAEDDLDIYSLVVANVGAHDAFDVRVEIRSCTDRNPAASPAQASFPGDLKAPTILAGRNHQIRLTLAGADSMYDIAECGVGWRDGNGEHFKIFRVQRSGW